MKLTLQIIISFLFFFPFYQNAQNSVSFECPDTVCVGESFEIINTSDFSNNVFWNFCNNDFTSSLEGGAINGVNSLNLPVYVDVVKDGNDIFAFVTNITSKLVRLKFEGSITAQPMVTNLSDLNNTLIPQTEGIQIINDNGHWWGFIVGGVVTNVEERLIRLDFGNSLENTPVATNLGNVGTLSFPHDLFIAKENGEWWGYLTNAVSNSITKLFFGDDLGNEPFGVNIGNLGSLNYPTGLFPYFHENKWYIFVTNDGDGTITRLDFGNLFSSFPTGVNLGNLGTLQNPRDIVISKNCKSIVGFVVDNGMDQLIKLDFGDNIENVPIATPLGNIGNFNFPHSISPPIIEDHETYFLIPNANNNSLSRIKFPNCDQSNPLNSTLFDPPPVTYDTPGKYTISYTSNIGLPTETFLCKEIVVVSPPSIDLGKDTTVCSSFLELNSYQKNTIWQNGETGSTINITESGWYVATVFNDYCSTPGVDSIFVEFADCESCIIFPNTFTPDEDQVNDLFQPYLKCDIPLENYEIVIYNRWGQKVYTSNDLQSGWDGKYNNKNASSDVYVWLVNYSYFDGEKIVSKKLKGDLTLIR